MEIEYIIGWFSISLEIFVLVKRIIQKKKKTLNDHSETHILVDIDLASDTSKVGIVQGCEDVTSCEIGAYFILLDDSLKGMSIKIDHIVGIGSIRMHVSSLSKNH